MRPSGVPVVKDLVLIGGGHSHVEVLKRFGMRPLPGVALTLIARDVHTPYSGMIPGYLAGHYSLDEAHIDLAPLSRFAGARLLPDEVLGIDLKNRQVLCQDRPPVAYDVLSINVGSTPDRLEVPGAAEHVLPVKPIDRFLQGWEEAMEELLHKTGRFRVAVVGAGAGGVELILSLEYRSRSELSRRGADPGRLEFHLFSATEQVLPSHNRRVQKKFRRILSERGIRVHCGRRVSLVEAEAVFTEDGTCWTTDLVIWTTHAGAPAWLSASGLNTDENGFVLLDERLRSVSHPEVFAAGDVATVERHPRPKSGVFAVRQGPPLTENLRRALLGRPLRPFRPQREFLSLISTGECYAVASRGRWALEGRWVWTWKDWIDRRFMKRYSELPEMEPEQPPLPAVGLADGKALEELSSPVMRCRGCGAKVGSTVLSRVLGRLTPVPRDDVLVGLAEPDDAAVLNVPAGALMVQSVDFFPAFLEDSYTFGRIAAQHSLGDLYAMGAEPQSALAVVTVPHGLDSKVEEEIFQMLSGALRVFREEGVALAGGHTGEGVERALGFVVTGSAPGQRLLRKKGMRVGDHLILTKPLGTGTLLAADMRGKAKGRWIEAAVGSMLRSNRSAAECLFRHGATACTDVTGFGLLGHLLEMVKSSDVEVEIWLEAIPLLPGARETLRSKIFSSLAPQNLRLRHTVGRIEEISSHECYPILFDPQTSGGLLASVPAASAAACLEDIHRLGDSKAEIVGCVHFFAGREGSVRVRADHPSEQTSVPRR